MVGVGTANGRAKSELSSAHAQHQDNKKGAIIAPSLNITVAIDS